MLKLPNEDLQALQHMAVESGPFKIEGLAKHLGHQLAWHIIRGSINLDKVLASSIQGEIVGSKRIDKQLNLS